VGNFAITGFVATGFFAIAFGAAFADGFFAGGFFAAGFFTVAFVVVFFVTGFFAMIFSFGFSAAAMAAVYHLVSDTVAYTLSKGSISSTRKVFPQFRHFMGLFSNLPLFFNTFSPSLLFFFYAGCQPALTYAFTTLSRQVRS
jgi:hypothetical protein